MSTPVPGFELDWNLVRTFVSVVKSGSLAGASRELGLAHPTVARHVQLLESQLDMVQRDDFRIARSDSFLGVFRHLPRAAVYRHLLQPLHPGCQA